MPKRVDDNQAVVVKLLRAHGISVLDIHELGHGAPDIACGYGGRNYFFEIKNPNKPPSARKLTPDEIEWHRKWRGQVETIETASQALEIMKPICRIRIKGTVEA